MSLKKKPVNGMKDILPSEMEVRIYVEELIRRVYAGYGFTSIETPALEDIGNLSSKQGGENEKLIFKILKRGQKLDLSSATTEEKIVDYGLRYDLTVPLVRYYSNNESNLPSPFKALQMGNVWRADRPQRGRYRQFTQCDIDIIGEEGSLAEIELILATTHVLGELGFKGFEVRINDRRILKALVTSAGFPEEGWDKVCISLDKLDKIGFEGVKEDLINGGFEKEAADRLLDMLSKGEKGVDPSFNKNESMKNTAKEGFNNSSTAEDKVKDEFNNSVHRTDTVKNRLNNTADTPEAEIKEGYNTILSRIGMHIKDYIDNDAIDNLFQIIETVEKSKSADFKMVFDPSLVRGMGYYTGSIFEISIPEFGGSCGGGGRYDKMVGSFTGRDVPACGFSIGFERIIMLLLESGFKVPEAGQKKAVLIDRKYPKEKMGDIYRRVMEERKTGKTVNVLKMKKNKKHQKEQLKEEGYGEIEEIFL